VEVWLPLNVEMFAYAAVSRSNAEGTMNFHRRNKLPWTKSTCTMSCDDAAILETLYAQANVQYNEES